MKQVLIIAIAGALAVAGLIVALSTDEDSQPVHGDSRADLDSSVDERAEELLPPERDPKPREDTEREAPSKDEAVTEETGALLNGRPLDEYISGLPRFTEDDSGFVEKYAGFTPEQLARAEELLMDVLKEEVEPWVLERERTGDYDVPKVRPDGKTGYPDWDKPKGRFLLRFRQVVDAEGRPQKARFTFPPEEYPILDLRVRERNYVVGRNFILAKEGQ